jgi:hypothetical protein
MMVAMTRRCWVMESQESHSQYVAAATPISSATKIAVCRRRSGFAEDIRYPPEMRPREFQYALRRRSLNETRQA